MRHWDTGTDEAALADFGDEVDQFQVAVEDKQVAAEGKIFLIESSIVPLTPSVETLGKLPESGDFLGRGILRAVPNQSASARFPATERPAEYPAGQGPSHRACRQPPASFLSTARPATAPAPASRNLRRRCTLPRGCADRGQ